MHTEILMVLPNSVAYCELCQDELVSSYSDDKFSTKFLWISGASLHWFSRHRVQLTKTVATHYLMQYHEYRTSQRHKRHFWHMCGLLIAEASKTPRGVSTLSVRNRVSHCFQTYIMLMINNCVCTELFAPIGRGWSDKQIQLDDPSACCIWLKPILWNGKSVCIAWHPCSE